MWWSYFIDHREKVRDLFTIMDAWNSFYGKWTQVYSLMLGSKITTVKKIKMICNLFYTLQYSSKSKKGYTNTGWSLVYTFWLLHAHSCLHSSSWLPSFLTSLKLTNKRNLGERSEWFDSVLSIYYFEKSTESGISFYLQG